MIIILILILNTVFGFFLELSGSVIATSYDTNFIRSMHIYAEYAILPHNLYMKEKVMSEI